MRMRASWPGFRKAMSEGFTRALMSSRSSAGTTSMMVSPAFTTPPTVVISRRLTTPSIGARSSRRATLSLRPVSCSASWAARSSASFAPCWSR
jgi:hypothetical protein